MSQYLVIAMDYIYRETELYELESGDIEAYIDFHQRIFAAYFYKELAQSREHIKKNMMIKTPKDAFKKTILVFDEDKVVARGIFSYRMGEQETNKDFCEFYTEVDPDYSNQGIGKTILSKLTKLADEHEKTKVEMWMNNYTLDGKVMDIVRKTGLKQSIEEKSNRLLRENINQTLLKTKFPELENRLKRFKLEKYTRNQYFHKLLNDEQFRLELVDFHNETINMIPKEDSEHNDVIYTSNDFIERSKTAKTRPFKGYIFMLWDGDKLAGFSETFYPEDDIRAVYTGFTGVRKNYHRKGIAMYLKLNMVNHYMKKDNFQYIDTENAQSNEGMLKINDAIGFQHVFSWMGFEGKIEAVKAYLANTPLIQ